VGGLVGSTTGTISNSYVIVAGNLEANHSIGGLAGVSSSNISNTFATVSGNISAGASFGGASATGGLVGVTYGIISNSHVNINGDVTGSGDWVGGLAGQANNLITNSYAVVDGTLSGGSYIGGIAGESNGIQNSYVLISEDVSGVFNVGGVSGKDYLGVSNTNVAVMGSVSASDFTGGLVGEAHADISDSFASVAGNISGENYTGGLVGKIWTNNISNSFSSIGGNITGHDYTGGLIGHSGGNILNSSTYIGGNISGTDYVGGLTGYAGTAVITNTDTRVLGNLTGSNYVGGLSGFFGNNSSGAHIDDSDSDVGGILSGISEVGGLIGQFYGGNIVSSYFAQGAVVGGNSAADLFGYIYPHNEYTLTYADDEKIWEIADLPLFPNFLDTINQGLSPTIYEVSACLNQGRPYLIEFVSTFTNNCTSGEGGRIFRERSFWKTIDVRATSKIEKTLGFKLDSAFPKDTAIKFNEISNKLDIAKLRSAAIELSANVRLEIKVEEALQISLKSESNATVELWLLSPDVKWLLAGVIAFDNSGKAILPPLQFKNAGDYSLVFSTPSTDSAKASAPFNIGSQLIISVI
jgi:hypothetical protein